MTKIITVSHEEIIETRIRLLKQMNDYIINLGDEEIWMDWITLGVPDEPSEEDYEFIVENEEEWFETCELFGKLVNFEGDK